MKSFAIFIEDLYACIYIIIIIMSLVHVKHFLLQL